MSYIQPSAQHQQRTNVHMHSYTYTHRTQAKLHAAGAACKCHTDDLVLNTCNVQTHTCIHVYTYVHAHMHTCMPQMLSACVIQVICCSFKHTRTYAHTTYTYKLAHRHAAGAVFKCHTDPCAQHQQCGGWGSWVACTLYSRWKQKPLP